MSSLLNRVGGAFIPVSDIQKARDWYCDLFDLPTDGEIFFDHIYVLEFGDIHVRLDSKIYAPENIINIPVIQFNTEHIEQAYNYMKSKQVELITDIENGQWFNFKDPDRNVFMVCM